MVEHIGIFSEDLLLEQALDRLELLLGVFVPVFGVEASALHGPMDQRLVDAALAPLSEGFRAALDLTLKRFQSRVGVIMLH